MPLPVAHALIGASLFGAAQKQISLSRDGRFMLLCAGLTIIPEFDFIFEWFFNLRGAHRGFMHSLFFGLSLGLLASYLVSIRSFRNQLGLFLASVSHACLDTLVTSSKGTGVALLWPITNFRFRLGVFDYFSFNFDPRFDPWIDIFIHVVKVSLVEFMVVGPVLLLVVLIKR